MREIDQVEARRLETVRLHKGGGEWMDIQLTAVPDFNNVQIDRFEVESGGGDPGLRQIMLERMTADLLGISVGDSVTLRLPEGERGYTLEVTGIVHDMHVPPIQFFELGTGYVSMETLQWMGLGVYYNRLDIIVSENPTDKAHIRHVAGLARDRVIEPTGCQVGSIKPFRGEPGTHCFSGEVEAVLIVLMVMGVMCILLSAGLVINTVSAQIARQVRQIGIMRSIGGQRGGITGMYIASIVIFSALALAVAIPLGLVGAKALAIFVGAQLNFDITHVDLPLSVALIQAAVGLLVPVGAALGPIMTGTSISIYDAINQEGNIGTVKKGAAQEALKRLKGLSSPAVLAVRNTFRRKARLAFTLATLTLAGATFMAAFTTHQALSDKIASIGPYFLFDVEMDVSGENIRTVEREALRLPEVGIAEAWYATGARVISPDRSESDEIEVVAIRFDPVTIDPQLVAGRWLQPGDTNAIVINEDVLDEAPDLAVGSQVVLRVESAERRVDRTYRVVGIVSRHLYGPRIYAPYDFFTKVNNAQNQASVVRVRVNPALFQDSAAQSRLADRLEQHFEDVGLETGGTTTQYDAYESNTSNFDILLSSLLLMSALLALVGGLGLAGTMGLNVLERTREIGVMRAVGGSNASVRRVVLFEGMFIGLISWMFSAVVALPFGYLLSNAVSVVMLDTGVPFQVSTLGVGVWLALVLVIAAGASLAPAQRASRLTVREVLAYE